MFGVLTWEIFTRCSLVPYFYMNICDIASITSFLKNNRRLSKPETMSTENFTNLVRLWHEDPKVRPKIGTVIRWLNDIKTNQDWLRSEGEKIVNFEDS